MLCPEIKLTLNKSGIPVNKIIRKQVRIMLNFFTLTIQALLIHLYVFA